MRLLSEFFKRFVEDSEKLILALIEDLLREVTSVYYSYQAKSIAEDVILESSIAIFKLFEAEATLMVLINNKASTAFLAKYRIESLHKGLILLRALLSNALIKNLVDGNLSTFVGAKASEASFLVCSFGDQKMEKDLNRKMHHLLSCLPRMIDFNITEIKTFYQPSLWSLFSSSPKSDGFGFLDILLGELRELLTTKPDIIAFMQDQVQVFMEELELVMALRKDVAEHLNENNELGSRVMCLIYVAEYIIDLFVTGEVPLWYHQLILFNVVLETKLIKAQVLELYDKKKCDCTAADVELVMRHMTVEATTPTVDEVIVGVDDQARIIIDQLQSGT